MSIIIEDSRVFKYSDNVSNPKKLNYLLSMPRFARNESDSYIFPLGIAYVSSCMKKAGYNVSTINLSHVEGTLFDILNKTIKQDLIDVVMVGSLSAQYSMTRTIVETVKKIDKNLLTVVGGGIITSTPKVALDALEYVDIGVIGEGDLTCVELCHTLENNGNLSAVDGLIFRPDNRIFKKTFPVSLGDRVIGKNEYIITNNRKEIKDIDSIPWPDYEGFDLKKNLKTTIGTLGFNENNTIAMISSRSCPYNCTFCFHTVGEKYRQRSLDGFFEELDYLVANYKINNVWLSDELFGRDIARLEQFCQRIKKYNLKWYFNLRVNDIVPEMLPLLKNSNCTIGFGLESADNRILKSMRKGITVEQIENALKLLYDAGVPFTGGFIFGDIAETLETAKNTMKWKNEHPAYNVNMRLITAYPGTYIYKYAVDKGIIKDRVKFLRDGCPQINVSKMSDEEFCIFAVELMKNAANNAALLSSFELFNINNKSGCIDIKGKCSSCGEINTWESIRLFKPNFISCHKCGKQFYPPLDVKIYANIDDNMLALLRKYDKLAIWGIANHAIDVLANSRILRDEKNIYLIDICSSKQHNLLGKQIFAPDIILKESIETVIITVPHHIGYIEAQIETNYRNVKRIIDISNMIGSDTSSILDELVPNS